MRASSVGSSNHDTGDASPGEAVLSGNVVVLMVCLLVWGLLFFYLVRLERRIKDLERK